MQKLTRQAENRLGMLVLCLLYALFLSSLVAQTVKNLPAVRKTWVQSLGWEDPLEKGMTTHSSILAWRMPWTEEPGDLWFIALHRIGQHWSNLVHMPAHIHINPKYQWGEGKIEGHNTSMLLESVWGKQSKTRRYLTTWKQENNESVNRYLLENLASQLENSRWN